MKTFNNLQRRTIGNEILMDDGGNAPLLGEIITIDGRLAEVTASQNELVNDSQTGGRFLAAFKP